MAKKDYVHRDISGGNILFYRGHGKLCDLEYAITPNARGQHGVRTVIPQLQFQAKSPFNSFIRVPWTSCR